MKWSSARSNSLRDARSVGRRLLREAKCTTPGCSATLRRRASSPASRRSAARAGTTRARGRTRRAATAPGLRHARTAHRRPTSGAIVERRARLEQVRQRARIVAEVEEHQREVDLRRGETQPGRLQQLDALERRRRRALVVGQAAARVRDDRERARHARRVASCARLASACSASARPARASPRSASWNAWSSAASRSLAGGPASVAGRRGPWPVGCASASASVVPSRRPVGAYLRSPHETRAIAGAARRCRRRPKPPPPGVWITKTSPAAISTRQVAPNSSRVPSARSTQLRPRCAGPPARPNGRTRRRFASITAVIGSRKRTRRSPPSPPRWRPPPPLPRRIAYDSSRTGKRHSSTSGSVSREFVMCVCTTLVPSKSGPGARAAGDRLVVLVRVVAEREVVHRALRRREHAERAVQAVGDRLRRLDVAGDDGRRIARAQHRAFGNDDRRAASGSPRSSGSRRRPACGTRRAPPPCRPPTAR